MARATLSPYEYRRDLLPPVCVRCGEPATDRVPRTLRVPPDQLVWLWGLPVLASLVFCPPLFLFIAVLIGERLVVRLPACPDHVGDWVWRDRLTNFLLLPVWSLVAIALSVCIVLDPERMVLYAGLAVLAAVAAVCLDMFVINGGTVLPVAGEKMDVQLRRVHPHFVLALADDRERDRREDPSRFHQFGDERDDYDDDGPKAPPPRRGPARDD
jgi:hypothetical protein